MSRPASAEGSRAGRRLAAVLVLAATALTAGCASSGSLLSPAPSGDEAYWQLPAGSFPSQRLYRVKYEGPEGKASFKLVLYLADRSHYRMAASDSLGRKLWTLQVDAVDAAAGGAVWLDHRGKEYCRVEGADRLVVVPLANLPLISLPRLLLGRLPAAPAANLQQAEGHLSYLDIRGQLWTAVIGGTGLEWWTLEDLGETVAWWRRDGDGGDFSDARGRQRVIWRQIVVEAVEQTLEPLEIPKRFEEGSCGED